MIKFRAWHRELKMMFEVKSLVFTLNLATIASKNDLVPSRTCSFDDIILMQSTGSFDKNGNEIFDGDIIRKKETTNETVGHGYQDLVTFTGEFVVHFEGGAFVTKGTRKKYYQSIDLEEIERVKYLLSQIGDGYEVVGNRYENPELVEVEE